MKLTRVTISGADDKVPLQALRDLSEEFPWVEWGILIAKKRFGTPRYPSTMVLQMLGDPMLAGSIQVAFHLCGELSRRVMGGDSTMVPRGIKCMQLNGFSDYVLPCLLSAECSPDVEFVLQCSTLQAIGRAEEFRKIYPNVSALWDQSGGNGVPLDAWPLPLGDLRIGYAGGIGERDVVELLDKISRNREHHEFWIDMESSVRTGDEFDLQKVRRVLELARPFVCGP